MSSTNKFASAICRANLFAAGEYDPVVDAWLAGYGRGLRRALHGSAYGTQEQHEKWLAAIDSPDVVQAAAGRGYKAGLRLEPSDPN